MGDVGEEVEDWAGRVVGGSCTMAEDCAYPLSTCDKEASTGISPSWP